MDNLQLTQVPVSKTGMLIRRTVADVFEAFISPEFTTKFWFTKSSGRLEAGRQIRWEWEMYNVSALVTVKVLEPNQRDSYHGSKECNYDATDVDAVHSVRNSEKLSGEKTAYDGTDDAYNNISARVTTAAPHHLVRKPTSDETYYNPRYYTHVTISFFCCVLEILWCFRAPQDHDNTIMFVIGTCVNKG